jgi:uncharacterized membrane protein
VTLYEWYVFVHVLAAAVWIGGAAALQLLAVRTLGTQDPVRIGGLAKDIEWIGTRVFVPASVLVLLFGVAAVLRGDIDWGAGWISTGLAVWVLSFVTGAAFLGPESGRVGRLVDQVGAGGPEVRARIRRLLLVSRVELLLLAVVVLVMVAKPGA